MQVGRASLLSDVIHFYEEDGYGCKRVLSAVKVEFFGEDGDDFGGLTRDLFANFWIRAIDVYFKGENAVVPHLPLHAMRKLRNDYIALGRILTHTTALCQYVPTRLSRSFLLSLIFGTEGVTDEVAVADFLLYVTVDERDLLRKAQHNYASLSLPERDKLVSIYSMYGLFEMPEQRLIDQQIKTLATVEMVDKPAPLVSLMQKGIPEYHREVFWNILTIPMIEHILKQTASTDKVISVLKTDDALKPEEENCLYLLKGCIQSFDQEDLELFLRFVTGGTQVPQDITVSFNSIHGLGRRPIAHTCSNQLEISTTYTSAKELQKEFLSLFFNEEEAFRMNSI